MVTYLSCWDHQYTVRGVVLEKLLKNMSYDELFRSKWIHKGAYIFTDMDRLGPFDLEKAAGAYQGLKASGATVLNDPGRVLTRFNLLRRLHEEGINQFNVYRPFMGEWPEKYPVFVRRDHFHSGVLSGLIESREELEKALDQVHRDGIPDSNVIVVEYAAEADANGVFRKSAVYRIGERYFREISVNDTNWVAKLGSQGVAGEQFYQQELEGMNEVPHPDVIRRVFEIANIDYGRVDFSIVDGKPQFYEINTNPAVKFGKFEHPFPQRVKSHYIFEDNYRVAIKALKIPSTREKVRLRARSLLHHRIHSKWRSSTPPTL